MSAAATVQPDTPPDTEPVSDLETLQDILYDMLAMGVDEEADATQVAIEGFLHEHAREPKSLAEFQAFFSRFSLRTSRVSPGPKILELPPIPAGGEVPRAVSDGPIELSLPDIEEIDWPETPVLPAVSLARPIWLRPAALGLALLGVALLIVAWRGYAMIEQLRSDLTKAAERHERDHDALQRLTDQAANLESSVAATGELIQRVDQKSDLLLDSLAPAKPQPRPAPAPPRGD